MKICAAQVRPHRGDIPKNIESHLKFIEHASTVGANLIVFPELSLTGYEPELAGKLAMEQDDSRLDVFRVKSNEENITICAGLPTIGESGIHISMAIFAPETDTQFYSKQLLHPDELPYFIPWEDELLLHVDSKRIAPAICYEALRSEHSENAGSQNADIYLTSVVKSAEGIEKAYEQFPGIAKQYSMTILMSNAVGECEIFKSNGSSACWDDTGTLVGSLDDVSEGLLVYDLSTSEVKTIDLG